MEVQKLKREGEVYKAKKANEWGFVKEEGGGGIKVELKTRNNLLEMCIQMQLKWKLCF